MHTPFKIDIVQHGSTVSVAIEGELDIATVPVLAEKLEQAERTDAALVVLDLAGVSFMDSSGLRALLEAHFRSQQNGGRLRITEGSEQVQRIVELTGLRDMLPFL